MFNVDKISVLTQNNNKGKRLMFDLLLRQIKEALCAPLARVIGLVLTPNQITLLAFLAGWLFTFKKMCLNNTNFGQSLRSSGYSMPCSRCLYVGTIILVDK